VHSACHYDRFMCPHYAHPAEVARAQQKLQVRPGNGSGFSNFAIQYEVPQWG
jgi:hypothetical protein